MEDGRFSTGTQQGKSCACVAVKLNKYILTLSSFCSSYGHDKSQAILPYRKMANPPTLFFFGDGVSGEHASSLDYGLGTLELK